MSTILKSNGTRERVSLDKILNRVRAQSDGLTIDAVRVSQRVVQGIHDGVTTHALDGLAAESAAALTTEHPDYSALASRIAITRLYKSTRPTVEAIFEHMADDVRAFAKEHLAALDAALNWERDLRYDNYFGFRTLERAYLLRDASGNIVERPQVMHMRIALGIHCGSLEDTLETYNLLSRGVFTHATPTMFNAGTRFPHMASCFLLPIKEDSIEGIMDTIKQCGQISKSAGGIGFSATNVRCQGSRIHSTGGTSAGLLPMLRCFESTARYVDQGGGKRKGAFAVYLEPWHGDVRTFLNLKKNHGKEELRVRDLFYALWIPDLFMKRVEADGTWTLFCPSKCPDLVELTGDAFAAAYEDYERTPGMALATLPAQELWFAILDAQIETGVPYMLYKDACNSKSNHQHLGVIRHSNLCTEIVQYSSADETAVCNLASVALPACVSPGRQRFDHALLADAVRVVTKNLNRIIDRNLYAAEQARRSNMTHRPIGIGMQGLADVFAMLDLPFDSPEARTLNREIAETMYYAALDMSCTLAQRHGTYASYIGSPVHQGKLQCDMWGVADPAVSGMWDWPSLRKRIAAAGLRNSLLIAPMPTASTAQILGNNECFEPFTSNVYVRRVLAGEFAVFNKHLVRKLERLGLWNDELRQSIIAMNGSVQGIATVPDAVKRVFKTAWELSMRTLIDMSADRGPYVDQSQSLNLFSSNPTHKSLSSMHFYAWKKGLKTGMYYLRTRPAADAVKVALSADVCAEACLACSA